MLKCGKKVYVCGLDGDFKRKKFGQILDLIPMCDKVEKLTSLCSLCKNGTRGIFSMRLTKETEQTVDVEVVKQETVSSAIVIKEQLTIAERIDEALPQVKGLDMEDKDLDDYANKAMDSYDRLMDLGFNVDDRNAGKIFEVASTMMNNAITAKTAKLEKKLKMVQLQLQAAKIAGTVHKKEEESTDSELTTDRNAILNLINQNLRK